MASHRSDSGACRPTASAVKRPAAQAKPAPKKFEREAYAYDFRSRNNLKRGKA